MPAVEGRILTLAADGPGLLAGGEFVAGTELKATNVARWDGLAWSPLGGGVPGVVEKLSASQLGVFAGVAATVDQRGYGNRSSPPRRVSFPRGPL